MLSVLLIEDEMPAMERLVKLIGDFDPDIVIAGNLGSVKGSIDWLKTHPQPDLIIADLQLSDGLSHEIFKDLSLQCPVVFVTAYDQYLVKALEFNCVDYVLKPVRAERFHQALTKYLKLRTHFLGNLGDLAKSLEVVNPVQHRFLVRKGTEMKSLSSSSIAWFRSEHKVTFALDHSGVRYLLDKSLTDLETLLPSQSFFRLNRNYIAAINAIEGVKSTGKGKLRVYLNPHAEEEVTVSQERANIFKEWLGA